MEQTIINLILISLKQKLQKCFKDCALWSKKKLWNNCFMYQSFIRKTKEKKLIICAKRWIMFFLLKA